MTAPDRQEMDSKIRKRSVMIAGHATSVSLEAAFWEALKDIAHARGQSVNALIGEIDRNRAPAGSAGSAGSRSGPGNLSSAVRVFVLRNSPV